MLSVNDLYDLADKRYAECISYLENRINHKFYNGIYRIHIYHQIKSRNLNLYIVLDKTNDQKISIDIEIKNNKPIIEKLKFCGKAWHSNNLISIDFNESKKKETIQHIESHVAYSGYAVEFTRHLNDEFIFTISNFVTTKLQQLLTKNYIANLNASYTLLLINKQRSHKIPIDVLKIIINKIFL